MLLELWTLQPFTLPDREVGVLNRQFGQRRRVVLDKRSIQGGNFLDEDGGGPAVPNDVVQRQQNNVFAFPKSQQTDPQQRIVRQIEGLLCLDALQMLSLSFTIGCGQVFERLRYQRNWRRKINHLYWLLTE